LCGEQGKTYTLPRTHESAKGLPTGDHVEKGLFFVWFFGFMCVVFGFVVL